MNHGLGRAGPWGRVRDREPRPCCAGGTGAALGLAATAVSGTCRQRAAAEAEAPRSSSPDVRKSDSLFHAHKADSVLALAHANQGEKGVNRTAIWSQNRSAE